MVAPRLVLRDTLAPGESSAARAACPTRAREGAGPAGPAPSRASHTQSLRPAMIVVDWARYACPSNQDMKLMPRADHSAASMAAIIQEAGLRKRWRTKGTRRWRAKGIPLRPARRQGC